MDVAKVSGIRAAPSQPLIGVLAAHSEGLPGFFPCYLCEKMPCCRKSWLKRVKNQFKPWLKRVKSCEPRDGADPELSQQEHLLDKEFPNPLFLTME